MSTSLHHASGKILQQMGYGLCCTGKKMIVPLFLFHRVNFSVPLSNSSDCIYSIFQYGYDYMTSGRKVLELFQARGWNTIVTDNLIYRTISMVSVVIGALAGLFGMVMARATGWATAALAGDGVDNNESGGLNVVFLLCFVIGYSLASILMATVLSATDAVIVCLAEAPQQFEANHPLLANEMMQKWRDVYPDECGF
jgi:Plasma-membrane choline transporter